jgi:hypothetical protein
MKPLIVLNGADIWYLTLMEEKKFKASENEKLVIGPKRVE